MCCFGTSMKCTGASGWMSWNASTSSSSYTFLPGISPGCWFSIIGSNLATTTRAAVASDTIRGFLPTSLDGVGVTVNGEPAPVSYVSPTQINGQIPSDIIPGPGEIRIIGGATAIAPLEVVISAVSPAFFLWTPSYVSATHVDGTLAVKAGEFPTVTTVPARPGEVIILLGTGFGATSPAAPLGQVTPASPDYNLIARPAVTIGGLLAPYVSGTLAPGQAGVYQIEVVVPVLLSNGDWPVIATVGGVASQTGALLTVSR